MTIRRGAEWGVPVPRPDDLVLVESDAALASAAVLNDGVARSVSAGDVHRAVGSPTPRATMQLVSVDLLRVVADEVEHVAVAHVVARRRWGRGPIVVVANVDHIGEWNVAPRAHPNDGRFDVVEVDPAMPMRQRMQARRRLPQGTHVPHPSISVRAGTDERWTFDHPLDLWVDGNRLSRVRELAVRIDPDAFELFI